LVFGAECLKVKFLWSENKLKVLLGTTLVPAGARM
jgi:hypothetical protein